MAQISNWHLFSLVLLLDVLFLPLLLRLFLGKFSLLFLLKEFQADSDQSIPSFVWSYLKFFLTWWKLFRFVTLQKTWQSRKLVTEQWTIFTSTFSRWVWNAFLMIADHYQQEGWHLTWHFIWDHLGEESHGHDGRALPGEVPFDLYENNTRFTVSLVSHFTVHCVLCDVVDVEVWLSWGDHCLSAWSLVAYKSCEGARSRAPPPACHWKPASKPPPGISRALHSATYCVHKTTEERVQLLGHSEFLDF